MMEVTVDLTSVLIDLASKVGGLSAAIQNINDENKDIKEMLKSIVEKLEKKASVESYMEQEQRLNKLSERVKSIEETLVEKTAVKASWLDAGKFVLEYGFKIIIGAGFIFGMFDFVWIHVLSKYH